ncbi:FKBP-type peptidyl-prolyl cis-trans isomerase [Hymenobacter terrenus]|uniref:FKBP-type peptidyl-prolyl cis-trans isomerase n=1 Tax=Hymenobacter terrenus TaxID=1629124 RepID=UPI0012E00748|nr:FKBP-type peptidyl-prolyl cis-trans isomerase [Hymenobacter terrenus]
MKNFLLHSRHLLVALSLLLAAPTLWSCSSDTTYTKRLREHENQLKVIDEDTIRNYLTRTGQLDKAVRTNSGLYVVPLIDGPANGTPVTAGKQVRVKYVGRFLSNGAHPGSAGYPASGGNPNFPVGSIFDNSADNRTECECAIFTAGGGTVAGFGEGLLLMRKGDRKLLLVPSRLGYGPNGQTNQSGGTVIPMDAALSFDVEVLDVY